MTRIDRRALFASGAAAALLAATGVSAMPKRGGVLRAALSGAARDQVWGPNGGLMIQAARSAVLEGLTEIAADGTLRGVLAERWDSREDGRIWTFQLRSENSVPRWFAAGLTGCGGGAGRLGRSSLRPRRCET